MIVKLEQRRRTLQELINLPDDTTDEWNVAGRAVRAWEGYLRDKLFKLDPTLRVTHPVKLGGFYDDLSPVLRVTDLVLVGKHKFRRIDNPPFVQVAPIGIEYEDVRLILGSGLENFNLQINLPRRSPVGHLEQNSYPPYILETQSPTGWLTIPRKVTMVDRTGKPWADLDHLPQEAVLSVLIPSLHGVIPHDCPRGLLVAG